MAGVAAKRKRSNRVRRGRAPCAGAGLIAPWRGRASRSVSGSQVDLAAGHTAQSQANKPGLDCLAAARFTERRLATVEA